MLSRCLCRSRCSGTPFALRSGWQPPSQRGVRSQQMPHRPARLHEPSSLRSNPREPAQRRESAWRGGLRGVTPYMRPKSVLRVLLTLTVLLGAHIWLSEQDYLPALLKRPLLKRKSEFDPYTLSRKQPVSSTLSIFHLHPGSNSEGSEAFAEAWTKGIWNVLFKQPQIQVVRAYTPLPPLSAKGPSQDLRFLIRHDRRGEVSSWLHRLPTGSTIETKGPNVELEIAPWTQHITFLAGGTGIATALQAANALLDRPAGNELSTAGSRPSPTIHILWASRKREDCKGGVSDHSASAPIRLIGKGLSSEVAAADVEKGSIVQELDALKDKYPNRVFVDYFVDEENTWITDDAAAKSISAYGRSDAVGSTTHQMIISGPDGFVSHLAGPKVWQNGRQEQGPVTGIVAQALTKTADPYKVWKV